MFGIKKLIFVMLFMMCSISTATDFEFRVDTRQEYAEIKPIWDIINLWSPSFLVDETGAPNTWHKDTHPFLQRVILMTATGGRPDYPELEIYLIIYVYLYSE